MAFEAATSTGPTTLHVDIMPDAIALLAKGRPGPAEKVSIQRPQQVFVGKHGAQLSCCVSHGLALAAILSTAARRACGRGRVPPSGPGRPALDALS
jgi:hypothetical protein